MGFICIICQKLLTGTSGNEGTDELVTTICGHLFHRKCLASAIRNANQNRGRGREKSQCPSCSRYLVSEQASFKIFPVEINTEPDEEPDATLSLAIDDIMLMLREENRKLKEQLRSLVSIVETINRNIKSAPQDHSVDSFNCLDLQLDSPTSLPSMNEQDPLVDYISSKRRQSIFSNCSSKSDYDSLTNIDPSSLNTYYSKLAKSGTNGEMLHSTNIESSINFHLRRNKGRPYKRVRREFLTTRNKTSSWLTKMTAKANKLISEAIISDTKSINQKITEIKFFMHKIETHGIIIEKLKETAKILMNYEGVNPMERNMTDRCSKELERDFCDMHLRTSDRIVTLEIALIRCSEIESFIEESNFLFADVENKLRILQENEKYAQSSKKTKLYELACLMRFTDSHKTNMETVKLSENDFRSCDNSQILPETESQLQEICSKYSGLVNKLKGMMETLIEKNYTHIIEPTNHQKRSPVFV